MHELLCREFKKDKRSGPGLAHGALPGRRAHRPRRPRNSFVMLPTYALPLRYHRHFGIVIYLSGNQIPLKFVGHIKGGQMRPLMDRSAADNGQKTPLY